MIDMDEVLLNGKTRRQVIEEQRLANYAQIDAKEEGDGERKPHDPTVVILAINAIGGIGLIAGLILLMLAFGSELGRFYLSPALASIFAGFILFGFASIMSLLRDIRDGATS